MAVSVSMINDNEKVLDSKETSSVTLLEGRLYHEHWWIQEGACPAHAPPKGPDSFVSTYKIFEA